MEKKPHCSKFTLFISISLASLKIGKGYTWAKFHKIRDFFMFFENRIFSLFWKPQHYGVIFKKTQKWGREFFFLIWKKNFWDFRLFFRVFGENFFTDFFFFFLPVFGNFFFVKKRRFWIDYMVFCIDLFDLLIFFIKKQQKTPNQPL